MAVPKLDLKRAGLVDEQLHLSRYERTYKWLQSCTDPSDSLEDTETMFSVQSEAAPPLESSRIGNRAVPAGCATSVRSSAQALMLRDTSLEQILGQVQGNPNIHLSTLRFNTCSASAVLSAQ